MAIITRTELEARMKELETYKGRHTELVTVYIPADYDVNAVQRQLEGEKSTAKNIKSTTTRNNVTEALEKIVRYLKGLKQTPPNGLALFAGNISKVEGQTDLQIWDIEPIQPLKIRMYRCDKEFILDPLRAMLEVTEVFGLIVMDRKEATIGMLEGKRIEVLQKMSSGVPSKVRAGGQSSQRFHRITEGLVKDFYKRIAEQAKIFFYDMPKLKGIIIGGPIPTKDEFIDEEFLPTKLREKIIGRVDIGDVDESGLKELVEKSRDILEGQEIVREKKILENFFEHLGEKPETTFYKEADVRKALQYGAVELLIISKDYDKNLTREFLDLAENAGSEVEIVSTETTEGEQFNNLSGVGALLRFKV